MIRAAVIGLGWWGQTILKTLLNNTVIAPVLGVDPMDQARAAVSAPGTRQRVFEPQRRLGTEPRYRRPRPGPWVAAPDRRRHAIVAPRVAAASPPPAEP